MPFISLRDLTKRYPPGVVALDGLTLDLEPGIIGLVGANGAGKSTLLKILYGLLKPERGAVHVRGTIAALIELGTGFQPQLTARENIRLVSALSGFTAHDAEDIHERVIDFAELWDVVDGPVQSYSTGMRARLAYALAAQLEPDVLLVDEVLAVGDLPFQRKCALHMRGFLDRGGSLLLVSHNTHQIQSLCERAILLDHGRMRFAGSAVEALTRMFELRLAEVAPAARPLTAATSGPVIVRGLRGEPASGDTIVTGSPMRLVLDYEAREAIEVSWGFSIWTWDQWVCVAGEHDPQRRRLTAGRGTFTCTIPRLPLVGGRYAVRAAVLDFGTRVPVALAGVETSEPIDVYSRTGATGNSQIALHQLVRLDVDWEPAR